MRGFNTEGKLGQKTKTFVSFDDGKKSGMESIIKLHGS